MIRNPEIQFASADAIAAFQQERLREEIAYLYENSPYYRRMFDHCGARPGDIRRISSAYPAAASSTT